MIDIHSHLLPDIDDGPTSMRESLAMARAAADAGTAVMTCTPHFAARYPTHPQQMLEAVERMRAAVEDAGITLDVRSGGEISLAHLPELSDDDLRAVSLGGTGTWLLVEMPFEGWPLHLGEVLADLEIRGFRTVLAHPERNEAVQRNPDRMRDAVGRGALVQVTAASFAGDHGEPARRAAVALLRAEFAHVMASDAHSARRRPPGLEEGVAAAAMAVKTEPAALRFMVEDGPRAILEGQPVRPPRLTPRRTPPVAVPTARRAVRRPTRR